MLLLFEYPAEPKGAITETIIIKSRFRCEELIDRSAETEWILSASTAETLAFDFFHGNEIFWMLPCFESVLFRFLDCL